MQKVFFFLCPLHTDNPQNIFAHIWNGSSKQTTESSVNRSVHSCLYMDLFRSILSPQHCQFPVLTFKSDMQLKGTIKIKLMHWSWTLALQSCRHFCEADPRMLTELYRALHAANPRQKYRLLYKGIKRSAPGADTLINTPRSPLALCTICLESCSQSLAPTTQWKIGDVCFISWPQQSFPQRRLQMTDVTTQLFNYSVFIHHVRMQATVEMSVCGQGRKGMIKYVTII